MAGNPTSITMISSACKNSNFVEVEDENCLRYMYKRIIDGKDTIIDEMGEGG